MYEYEHSKMEVYGNRTELEKFMSDVHGDGKSVFCFGKVFDLQDVTPDRIREPFPGLEIYRTIHLKSQLSESDATLSDEVEYLKYSFTAHYSYNLQIYDVLTNKYPNLKFKILIQDIQTLCRHEMALIGGEYLQNIHFYWKEVPWRANCLKRMLYKDDLIKKTLQVIKEEIICSENDSMFDGTQEFDDDEALLIELEDL